MSDIEKVIKNDSDEDVDQEDMTLRIGETEDNFVENSLHLAEILPLFFFEMFNEYMIYYKNVNREAENTNLFDGVDIKNKMSTNKQLEYFYEAKFKFEEYQKTNPELTNVYTPDNFTDNSDNELFGIRKNNILEAVSPSLFALFIEIVNLKREHPEDLFEIIPIRRE